MAEVLGNNQVKLNSGKIVQADQGAWYDGQHYWSGTLSNPGEINKLSNQLGAGQPVSTEVIAQTNPNNVAYINEQRQQQNLPPSPTQTPSSPSSNQFSSLGDSISNFSSPQVINLPKMYEDFYASSGIRDLETELNSKVQKRIDAIASIKNNPYLSEATMTGRINKIETKASAEEQSLRDQISTRKADIETKLNLQTKQLDINNQQTKLAWDQFNTLLASGALDDASGQTIAQWTMATGIPSDAIYSAIKANKKKNEKVSVQTFNSENGEVWAVALDQNTGKVVNKTSLGIIGNVQGKSGSSTPKPSEVKLAAGQAAKSGKTYQDMLSFFVPYGLTPKDVYSIYTSANYYGRPPDKIDPKTGLPKTKK